MHRRFADPPSLCANLPSAFRILARSRISVPSPSRRLPMPSCGGGTTPCPANVRTSQIHTSKLKQRFDGARQARQDAASDAEPPPRCCEISVHLKHVQRTPNGHPARVQRVSNTTASPRALSLRSTDVRATDVRANGSCSTSSGSRALCEKVGAVVDEQDEAPP